MKIAIVYKLLRPDLTTHQGCQWRVGEWRETTGHGELCGPGWLHAYTAPELAVLLNPIHAKYQPCILYRAEATGQHKTDHGLKVGYTAMRIVEPIALPTCTPAQRIAFGLLCARTVYADAAFTTWAQKWLSGADRSEAAAKAAAKAAQEADKAAAQAAQAAWEAAEAAWAAASADEEAAAEADGAWAAAVGAAEAAAWAAAEADGAIDLIAIAKQALTYT